MAKVTRLNVAVTANTRQFDARMKRMSRQIKAVRMSAAEGVGGAFSAAGIGGGLGAGAGMAARGGPLLIAIGGLTAALESARKATEQGRADLSEAAALALSPSRQMEARVASQLIKGESGTAGDIVGAKRGLTTAMEDRMTRRRLERDGFDLDALDDLASTVDISDFTEKLIEFSKGMSDSSRLFLAEQLGGKTGEMLLASAGVRREGNISSAIDQAVSPEALARARSIRMQDEIAATAPQDPGFWTSLWDLISGQSAKTEQQMDPVLEELQRQTAVMSGNQPASDSSRLFSAEQSGGETGEMLMASAGVRREGNIASAMGQSAKTEQQMDPAVMSGNRPASDSSRLFSAEQLGRKTGEMLLASVGVRREDNITSAMGQSAMAEQQMDPVLKELQRQTAMMSNNQPASI